MDNHFEKLLDTELLNLGIKLDGSQVNQFYEYYQVLMEWNKVMNLTAITEMEEVITKHFVDSLTIVKAIENMDNQEYSIIDVGTGAGFPGIPLKIVYPQLKVTLLDSLNKRIKFLNEVNVKLGLKGIETVHGRAEDYGRNLDYRESFDLCVSRAVANIATLTEYCMPFVKVHGCFISYKSIGGEEEVKKGRGAIKLLSGKLEDIISFKLPNTEAERTLIKIRKVEPISKRYPRKAGLPAKEPLT